MSITFGRMPGVDCTAAAVKVVEGYTPKETAHGSLDAVVYVCEEHHQACRDEWLPGLGMTTPYTLQHPPLHPQQCGYLVNYRGADEDEADEAVTEAVEDAHRELGEVVQSRLDREAKGCTHPPNEPCFGKGTTRGSVEKAPETPDVGVGLLDPMPYRLTVDDRVHTRGTLQEIQAAVAELVTMKLAINPVSFAQDAHRLNAAFGDGSVQRAVEEGGEWSTTVAADSAYPVRLRVTKEG